MAKTDFWFSYRHRVRYAEVDAQGIVFFGNYASYFDAAHTEYMRALPFDFMHVCEESGADFHIVRMDTEFHAPARFDEEIEVYVRTAYIGRSSMRVKFEAYRAGSECLLTSSRFIIVNTDQATMSSTPWPEKLVDKITQRELRPVERPKD